MSVAILIVGCILGLITFLLGVGDVTDPTNKSHRPALFAIGTAIILVSILALAWVPALERWIVG
jgi:hypothetical protein